MGESLIQPSRVQDECPMGCKLLLLGKNSSDLLEFDGTFRVSTG